MATTAKKPTKTAEKDATKRDAAAKGGRIRAGIAGWQYAPWRGTFYPKGLVQRRELEYASSALPCIEINSTFYRLQAAKTFANWYAQTADNFVFSLKAPKRITHEKRLQDVEDSIAYFLTSGPFELKEKLGPILWQFPPSFKFDPALFEPFLALLPHDTKAAWALADKQDKSAAEGPGRDTARPLRHAVEIRNASFVDPVFIDMLRKYGVAMVVADTSQRWPEFEDVCTDFMYLRLHGADEMYTSGYSDSMLDDWASRIAKWAAGDEPAKARLISDTAAPEHPRRDVFCYFDNTMKEEAPLNATRLLEKLGMARKIDFDPGK